MKIDVMVASVGHLKYVKVINDTIDEAQKPGDGYCTKNRRIHRR